MEATPSTHWFHQSSLKVLNVCDFNNIQLMQYTVNDKYYNWKCKQMKTVYNLQQKIVVALHRHDLLWMYESKYKMGIYI